MWRNRKKNSLAVTNRSLPLETVPSFDMWAYWNIFFYLSRVPWHFHTFNKKGLLVLSSTAHCVFFFFVCFFTQVCYFLLAIFSFPTDNQGIRNQASSARITKIWDTLLKEKKRLTAGLFFCLFDFCFFQFCFKQKIREEKAAFNTPSMGLDKEIAPSFRKFTKLSPK